MGDSLDRLRTARSPKRIASISAALTLFVVRSVFADALHEGLIVRNPAERVKPAGKAAKARGAMPATDVRKVSAHLASDRLYACWLLTIYGLRRSELLGLRWSDVNLSEQTVTIRRGRVLVDGKRTVETEPKTIRGARTLHLSAVPSLLRALRTMRKEQLAEFGADQVRGGYLAVDEVGEPMRHERWSDLWREHCKDAGVPVATLHAARHSSVTIMRDAGVPDHHVAEWHGHDETIMRNVYSHANASGLAAAGAALAAALGGTE